jgi:hypothetical protein
MSSNRTSKYLIIGGTFKSGTSSLYTYLNQHKDIHGSSIKETGFFVPARYGRDVGTMLDYEKYFEGSSVESWRLEASPGYLYGGNKIISSIEKMLGKDVKFIFMLREPSKRFVSFYKMLKQENVQNVSTYVSDNQLSLGDYFDKCESYEPNPDNINEDDDFIFNGLNDGDYAQHLKVWYDTIPEENIKIVFFDELANSSDKICIDVCDWIGVSTEEIQEWSFRKVNQFRAHRSGTLKKIAQYINYRFESFFRRNEKLKRRLVSIYEKMNSKKTTPANKVDPTMAKLKSYYQSKNKELAELLRSKGYTELPEWLNV